MMLYIEIADSTWEDAYGIRSIIREDIILTRSMVV